MKIIGQECFENENFNGMEEEFNKIQDKLEELMPLEKLIRMRGSYRKFTYANKK